MKASDNEFPSVLLDEQASAPTTPASGFWRLYAKATGLFMVDDAGGETGPFSTGAGSGIPKGTAFPGSPSADDLFYRTDRNIIYFYDGTRWLCICPHDMSFTTRTAVGSGYSATATVANAPTMGSAGNMYVEDLIVMAFANGGAFDASNRWAMVISTRDAANTNTDIGTVNMNSQTSATWKEWAAAVDAVVDGSTQLGFNLAANKTGSPGALIFGVRVTYRLVG